MLRERNNLIWRGKRKQSSDNKKAQQRIQRWALNLPLRKFWFLRGLEVSNITYLYKNDRN